MKSIPTCRQSSCLISISSLSISSFSWLLGLSMELNFRIGAFIAGLSLVLALEILFPGCFYFTCIYRAGYDWYDFFLFYGQYSHLYSSFPSSWAYLIEVLFLLYLESYLEIALFLLVFYLELFSSRSIKYYYQHSIMSWFNRV